MANVAYLSDSESHEKWVTILRFEDLYEASSLGRIRALRNKIYGRAGRKDYEPKIIAQSITPKGYARVTLFKNGVRGYFSVHRLVAAAFIPNPNNKTFVNHINGVKNDNRLCNVEWVTPTENAMHSIKVLGRAPSPKRLEAAIAINSVPVMQYDLCNNYIATFSSIAQAALSVKGRGCRISECASGKRKAAYNFVWKKAA